MGSSYDSAKPSLKVVKIGGAVIDNPEALKAFLKDFSRIAGAKILVHGGGRAASALCKKLDISVQMVDGRRITDAASLDVAVMVYAGLVNKQIVAALQALGCNAAGLCGADGNSIIADRRPPKPIDFGFVGDVKFVNPSYMECLLQEAIVPVVSPITHNGEGDLLNTNADTVAQAVAEGLAYAYDVELIYCFEQPGVLADADDPKSVIPEITPSVFAQLKEDGVVSGGMLPKLDNAFHALMGGVGAVAIKSAANLLNPIGTVINYGD